MGLDSYRQVYYVQIFISLDLMGIFYKIVDDHVSSTFLKVFLFEELVRYYDSNDI